MGFNKSSNKYNLDYIYLPSIHPNPLNSIKISQEIHNLLYKGADNLINQFQKLYNSFDLEDKYFFSKYCFEYFSFDYYHSLIQTYLKELEQKGIEESTIYINEQTGETIRNDSLSLKYLTKEVEITKQIESIIIFLRDKFPNITHKLKTLYRDRYHEVDDDFIPETYYSSDLNLNENVYRISISNNTDDFINEVRVILRNVESHQIDSFIYNSFSFKGNNRPIALCDLNFGNSSETNRLIHSIYDTYKNIVKKKTSRFDFAKIMFLNFAFIQQGWTIYSKVNPDVLRETYLKTNVASNIEK